MYLAREQANTGTAPNAAVGAALEELDGIYGFLLGRVGGRADAEDLTQQVALKALPRLRAGASTPEVRASLYTTARSALAAFWARRYRLPESELLDGATDPGPERGRSAHTPAQTSAWLAATLAALPEHYRRVLELRFLQGCSIRETAREMGKTDGAVKVMQLRALRAAALGVSRPPRSRPEHRPLEAAPGSAFETPRVVPGA